jgi:hypothetical protein
MSTLSYPPVSIFYVQMCIDVVLNSVLTHIPTSKNPKIKGHNGNCIKVIGSYRKYIDLQILVTTEKYVFE